MSTYSHLGASPEAATDEEAGLALGQRLPKFAELRERLLGGGNASVEDGGLLAADGHALHPRFARLRAGVRRLVFELLPATDADTGPVWTLTATGSGDGTTTVAAVMAATAAEDLTRPVLLVEGDLRHPKLAELLSAQAEPGLSDVLAGDASLVDAMQETSLPGLWLLPAGTAVGQPVRLLRSPVIGDLIDAARQRFGAVVVDAPAVLESSEAALLACWADRTMLVVASGQTAMPDVRRAVDLFGPERELGVILNAVEPELPGWLERLAGDDGR
jgi:capsular exopolysaccharide synthesis family protein